MVFSICVQQRVHTSLKHEVFRLPLRKNKFQSTTQAMGFLYSVFISSEGTAHH
jgi:hypothetical protein